MVFDLIADDIESVRLDLLARCREVAQFALEILDDRIFNKHLDSEGEVIGPTYSSRYAAFRRSRGLQAEVVDLQFTGQMRDGFKIVDRDTGCSIIIEAGDPARRSRDLEETTYPGQLIFCYNDEELQQIQEFADKVFAL